MRKITFGIEGMTCGSCVQSLIDLTRSVPGVHELSIQQEFPQARLTVAEHFSTDDFKRRVEATGKYKLIVEPSGPSDVESTEAGTPSGGFSVARYKPLIMIGCFIAGTTLLVQYPFDAFDVMIWMRHFMAGFFIVFAFFKLLNLQGFADAFSMYDIVAARSRVYAKVYPFIELGLGLAFLINIFPVITSCLTILILGIGSVGVIKSTLTKRQIQCACLGDVFDLPMSTVTIIENMTMIAMAIFMLFVW